MRHLAFNNNLKKVIYLVVVTSTQAPPNALKLSKRINIYSIIQKYSRTSIIRKSIIRNVKCPNPHFSSFYVQTTKNQRLLRAIKYCVIAFKYCILYVLYCIVMVTLSQGNLQILCTVWLLGSVIRTIDYPNYRWSQLVRIIDLLL